MKSENSEDFKIQTFSFERGIKVYSDRIDELYGTVDDFVKKLNEKNSCQKNLSDTIITFQKKIIYNYWRPDKNENLKKIKSNEFYNSVSIFNQKSSVNFLEKKLLSAMENEKKKKKLDVKNLILAFPIKNDTIDKFIIKDNNRSDEKYDNFYEKKIVFRHKLIRFKFLENIMISKSKKTDDTTDLQMFAKNLETLSRLSENKQFKRKPLGFPEIQYGKKKTNSKKKWLCLLNSKKNQRNRYKLDYNMLFIDQIRNKSSSKKVINLVIRKKKTRDCVIIDQDVHSKFLDKNDRYFKKIKYNNISKFQIADNMKISDSFLADLFFFKKMIKTVLSSNINSSLYTCYKKIQSDIHIMKNVCCFETFVYPGILYKNIEEKFSGKDRKRSVTKFFVCLLFISFESRCILINSINYKNVKVLVHE